MVVFATKTQSQKIQFTQSFFVEFYFIMMDFVYFIVYPKFFFSGEKHMIIINLNACIMNFKINKQVSGSLAQ